MRFQLCCFLVFSFATSLVQLLNAQLPPICPPDEVAVMSPFCEDACIICDIDGFTGRNGRDEDYFLPPDFCTQVQHNGKWIGFIAGSEDLSVRLSVRNCELNFGLEISIYEASDCRNPVRVGSCFGGFTAIPPNTAQVFQNTQPLVIGQHYYIVMDGALDDVCDWEFTVIEGTTQLQPLTVSGPITGPTVVCPNVSLVYYTEVEVGATTFNWTVNGNPVATGQNAEITWAQEGLFELCVTASNACDEADPFCKDVLVRTIPTTVIDTTFCSGDSFTFGDSVITEGGQYTFNFQTLLTCDSNFVINITEETTSSDDLNINICADDILELNGQSYTQAGSYQQILTNQFGCDSILNLTINTIVCDIQASQIVEATSCTNTTDGLVRFSIINGIPPFSYTFTRISGENVVSGNISNLNEEVMLNNLAPGNYQITVLDEFGNNTRILNIQIDTPPILAATSLLSDFNGFNISCFGENDGNIEILPSGGTPPYSINWSDGSNDFQRNSLEATTYAYTLSDANGCQLEGSITLTAPEEITATLLGTNGNCDGQNTASIRFSNVQGGAASYQYRLNNGELVADGSFTQLPAGIYEIEIIDGNGCSSTFIDTLNEATIPSIELGEEIRLIQLGESSRITISSINADTIILTSEVAMNVVDSSEQHLTIMPFESGMLIATAISADGCLVTDSLRFIVNNPRRLYAPNAFSPNGDGINDEFRLFPGQSVSGVEQLQIFDRWGGLVFEQSNTTPFWTGNEAAEGVYIWKAKVIYKDNSEEILSGDVMLLR